MNMLTLFIFIPALFGLLILVLPDNLKQTFKYITLAATLIQLALGIYLYLNFKTGAEFAGINHEQQFQFVQKLPWISLNLGNAGRMQVD